MAEISLSAAERLPALFYEAAVDDARWSDAIGEVKATFNIALTGFGWFAESESASVMLHGDCEPYYERLFHELQSDNLFLPHMRAAKVGQIFHDSAIMAKEQLKKTAMYNAWFMPQDLHCALVARVPGPPAAPGFLILQRGGHQPDFDERDMRLFAELLSPLMHALQLRERMSQLRLTQRGRYLDEIHIGFVVTDASGRIRHSNEAAERAMAQGAGLIAVGSRITAEGTGLSALIASAVRQIRGVAGGELIVRDPASGHPHWALTVGPVRDVGVREIPVSDGAMIFIRDLSRPASEALEGRIAGFFGLTQREASLAAALASGNTLEDIAVARSVSMATIRSQLASVFRKTDTTRQSQLVALLLRAVPATL